MIYTIDEIVERITPVAMQYNIPAIYLFGSYARNEATSASDIDLLVDTTETGLTSALKLGALCCDLEAALDKPVDMVTLGALMQKPQMQSNADFKETVLQEMVVLYTESRNSTI